MRKLIAVLILCFSTQAFAGGKVVGNLDAGASNYTLTVPYRNTEGNIYKIETIRGEAKLDTGVRAGVGYELDTDGLFTGDLVASINSSLVPRIEGNLIYKASDTVHVKAGPNVSYRLKTDAGYTNKPGVGGQAGVEIKLNKDYFLNTQYSFTQQSDLSSNEITTNYDNHSVSVGIGFRF